MEAHRNLATPGGGATLVSVNPLSSSGDLRGVDINVKNVSPSTDEHPGNKKSSRSSLLTLRSKFGRGRSSSDPSGGASSPGGVVARPFTVPSAGIPDTCFDASKHFQGGSLQRCVEYVVVERDDASVQRALLYCFRSFAAPADMLSLLTKLDAKAISSSWGTECSPAALKDHVTKLLLDWIQIGFSFDFQPDRALVSLLHDTLKALLPTAEHNKLKLMLVKHANVPHGMNFPEESDALQDTADLLLRTEAKFFLQQDAVTVAAELSYIDYELYRAIEATELMNKNWQRDQAKVLAPNLVELRKRFNQLSFWVMTLVLKAAQNKAAQIRLVSQFLDLAHALYELKNFNSLGAVVAALNSVSLSRLHYIWNSLSQKDRKRRDELNAIMDPEQNFKQYRRALIDLAATRVSCIPYIPLHLRDMLTIYEREESYLAQTDSNDKPMINFEKMMALGNAMHSVLQFRGTVQWKTTGNVPLRDYLLKVQFCMEDDLLTASDRWKALEKDVVAPSGSTSSNNPGPRTSVVQNTITSASVRGRVIIMLKFEAWTIYLPFRLDSTFAELKKTIKALTGTREMLMYYPSEAGLFMTLNDDDDLFLFLRSSENLVLDVQHSRLVVGTTGRNRKVSTVGESAAISGAPRWRSTSVVLPSSPIVASSDPSLPNNQSASAGSSPRLLISSSIPDLSSATLLDGMGSEFKRLSKSIGDIAATPSMSPHGAEKRRILVVELTDPKAASGGGDSIEIAVPLSVTYDDMVALLTILFHRSVSFAFREHQQGDSLSIDDESSWQKVLKTLKKRNESKCVILIQ